MARQAVSLMSCSLMEIHLLAIDQAERTGELTAEGAAMRREIIRAGGPLPEWFWTPDRPAVSERIREQERKKRDDEIEREPRWKKVGDGHYVWRGTDEEYAQYKETGPVTASRPRVQSVARRAPGPRLRQSQTQRRSHRSTGPPSASSDDDSGGGEPPGDLVGGKLGAAIVAVRRALWNRMLPSVELLEKLHWEGHERRTVERALVELRAKAERVGFGPGSVIYRRLPDPGEIVFSEQVGRWQVPTPNRYGETRIEQRVRHWAAVKYRQEAERQRERFRAAVPS